MARQVAYQFLLVDAQTDDGAAAAGELGRRAVAPRQLDHAQIGAAQRRRAVQLPTVHTM